mgnify:CR=1 FL=1|jgi:hypothetical protein
MEENTKSIVMKKLSPLQFRFLNIKAMMVAIIATMLSSCIVITDSEYGPDGKDGRAYFGIDYDWNPPYSYWDNNVNVPDNPFFGEHYRTHPGTFEFEYFLNEYDYWYGTYSMWVIHGEHGQPYNQPGADGADNYLLLICNENGFYFERWDECDCYRTLADGTQVIEFQEGDKHFKIEMKKTNTTERPTRNVPKYKQ